MPQNIASGQGLPVIQQFLDTSVGSENGLKILEAWY